METPPRRPGRRSGQRCRLPKRTSPVAIGGPTYTDKRFDETETRTEQDKDRPQAHGASLDSGKPHGGGGGGRGRGMGGGKGEVQKRLQLKEKSFLTARITVGSGAVLKVAYAGVDSVERPRPVELELLEAVKITSTS